MYDKKHLGNTKEYTNPHIYVQDAYQHIDQRYNIHYLMDSLSYSYSSETGEEGDREN